MNRGKFIMTIKLPERYYEIQGYRAAMRALVAGQAGHEVIQEKMTQLEAKQDDLKRTLLHVIVLSKRREKLQAFLAKYY